MSPDLPVGVERRYAHGDVVAHLILSRRPRAAYLPARCGAQAPDRGWRGTADQYQATHATSLPLCEGCEGITTGQLRIPAAAP